MAKVTPVLWTQKTNKQGRAPIYLRISDTAKTRYVSLRVMIRPSQWNERAGRVRKGHKQADAINTLITRRVAEAEEEMLRLQTAREPAGVDRLKETLALPEGAGDFFTYADGVIADFERRGKLHSHKRFKAICGKFRRYAGEALPFERITPRLLHEYETHLIEHYGNGPNTVASNLRCIRTILYRAIREGVFPQEKNPFFQFRIKQGRPNRDKLTLAELKAIEAVELEPGSLLWHTRNYFLFSFYCAGIRFGDLAELRRKHIMRQDDGAYRLQYRMSKTGGAKSIKLLPQAEAILGHYLQEADERDDPETFLLPILDGYDVSTPRKLFNARTSQNALTNKYLKKIAKLAGVRCKLSFHISRHSFADIARQRGWDVYTISKALGHANIKVTETYLKGFDADALDEKMERLFTD